MDRMIGSCVAIMLLARRPNCDRYIHCLGNGEAPLLALISVIRVSAKNRYLASHSDGVYLPLKPNCDLVNVI